LFEFRDTFGSEKVYDKKCKDTFKGEDLEIKVMEIIGLIPKEHINDANIDYQMRLEKKRFIGYDVSDDTNNEKIEKN